MENNQLTKKNFRLKNCILQRMIVEEWLQILITSTTFRGFNILTQKINKNEEFNRNVEKRAIVKK